ncbi:quercetin dioxygenase-like cupin family protein [Ulvibacter sp. MAR_2010_11]|uniref:cupin domain-containing protein n=1 Tax=Ulvibacter sp. MAR_2010_11 TaxID=1250229 RepID=UPI000CAC3F54|nr:cupin domain-containing protein [Ulvibacter sp. MAR_2010_11]PKA83091.1 quercetin dioxygenase-like cupin family protein [Ulvibacter sp. MAR_2010_11]
MKSFVLLVTTLVFSSCEIQVKEPLPDPLQAGWEQQAVCEILQENSELRVLQCTFPPGVGHERHYHNAHFGYTLAGSKFRIKDTTGTREVNVPTGYNYYNERIEWHEVLNIGDSTAVFLIFEPK